MCGEFATQVGNLSAFSLNDPAMPRHNASTYSCRMAGWGLRRIRKQQSLSHPACVLSSQVSAEAHRILVIWANVPYISLLFFLHIAFFDFFPSYIPRCMYLFAFQFASSLAALKFSSYNLWISFRFYGLQLGSVECAESHWWVVKVKFSATLNEIERFLKQFIGALHKEIYR